tara:strand:- start:12 stop:440 length:429 start_codon:yes stop_codon:yes gene_type:complete
LKYLIEANKIYVSMVPGDLVIKNLTKIAQENNIQSGWISGIGAIESVSVGMYNLNTKEYEKKFFNDEYELLSLSGNISIKNGVQFIHAHIAFSDSSFKAYGGHLFETKIYAAGEFMIHKSKCTIYRKFNKKIGLPAWCFIND